MICNDLKNTQIEAQSQFDNFYSFAPLTFPIADQCLFVSSPEPIEPKLKRCIHLFIDSFILVHCYSLLSLSMEAKRQTKSQTAMVPFSNSFPFPSSIDDSSSWCFHFIVFRPYSYWLYESVCLIFPYWPYIFFTLRSKSRWQFCCCHIFVFSARQKEKDKLLIKTKWIISLCIELFLGKMSSVSKSIWFYSPEVWL